MMPRCSGVSALAEPGRPSKAANGLETGLGACARGACARASSACAGVTILGDVDLGAAIEPVVAGRAAGSGTFCASAGAAVRQANNAAIATFRPVRALNCPAITISAPPFVVLYLETACGYFAAQPVSVIRA